MLPTIALALAPLALALGAAAKPASYAVWAADSAIARKQGNGLSGSSPITNYEHGELWFALRRVFEKTGNATYATYVQTAADQIVSSAGVVGGGFKLSDHQLDPIRTGPALVWLYGRTNQAKYATAAKQFRSALDVQPRTSAGQFWHKQVYTNQGWLDGIYMADIFYADYTKAFTPTNTTAWNDILNQYTLMYDNTLVKSGNGTGLLYHGYDASKKASWASSDRGHSLEVWDRAVGWYVMALVDTLDILAGSSAPAALASTLKGHLAALAPKIVQAADAKTGVWWLVMSQPGRAGNYFESSGAVMFVYALLRGIRQGYLADSDGSIKAAAKKAFEYIVANWVVAKSDGTMDWKNTVSVGSLKGDGDYAYYIAQSITTNDLKGLAAFALAALEYEAL